MMCEICNETRGIQKCHIITRKLDYAFKDATKFNLLELCPTHHWAFDHDLLTESEYNKIQGRVRTMLRIFNDKIALWEKATSEDKKLDCLMEFTKSRILWNKTIKNRIFGESKCLQEENKSS